MARMMPSWIWMVAGRIPSGRTTRLLRIARSTAMEKIAEEILRYAAAVACYRTNVVDRTDFVRERGDGITAIGDGVLGAEATQRDGRDTAQRDAGFPGAAILDGGEADLRDGLRLARADLAVVLAPARRIAAEV